jgi:haloacetate dehalogenase
MFDGFALDYAELAEDVRLRYRIGGDGPPVVLLHGHPARWRRSSPATEPLNRRRV